MKLQNFLLIVGLLGGLLLGEAQAQAAVADDPRWVQLEQRLASPENVRGANWVPSAELAWTLYEAHPADPRRWHAWNTLLRNTPRFQDDETMKRLWTDRDAALEKDMISAADVPVALQELFAARRVSAFVREHIKGRLSSDWQERLVPPIEELAARFPGGSSANVYFAWLLGAVETHNPAGLPALIERMAASPNLHVQKFAAERRKVLAHMAQRLDLKFTALDGREVDTTKLRGKVVLVDFWATWCMPCIAAMPHLKELYAKYHDRGLEIINISVDQANARPALEKLVAKLELPWPQFFDGKGPGTEYAVRYGVRPIPHVLLAGPDGMIVAVNPPKEKLEAEIKRLLQP